MTNQYAGIQFVHVFYYDPADGEIKQGPESLNVDEYSEFTQQLKKDHDIVYLHSGRRLYDNPVDYDTIELIARVSDGQGDLIPAADPNPGELTRAKQRFAMYRKKVPLPEPETPPTVDKVTDKVLVRNVYDSTVYADTAVSPDGQRRGRIPRKGKAYVSAEEAKLLVMKDLVVKIVE